MKSILLTLALLVNTVALFAQTKQLVPEEIITNRKLYPTTLSNLQWVANTGYYTYQVPNAVLRRQVNSDQADTLLRLSELNSMLEAAGRKPLQRIPSVTWAADGTMLFSQGNDFLSVKEGTVRLLHSLPDDAENTDKAPVTGYMAYTVGNNLYISAERQIAITADTDKGIVNGQSVHRNEFGISKGTYWSPQGNKLAFYRMDETMVTEYPLVDITARVAELNSIRYPMAGMKSHHVTLGIYDVSTGKTLFVKTGEPAEQYLTNIAWSPDQTSAFIAVLNRDQNHMKLNQYDANTGEFIKTLFEEKNDRYVEPQNPMVFVPGNPQQFIWQSQRDGYNHLYLYNISGKLEKQLTSGNWIVNELLDFGPSGKGVYFTSTEPSPTGNYLYYTDLKTGKRQRLTPKSGTHSVKLRPDGKYFISTYSNLTTPPVTQVVETKSLKSQTINKAANPLTEYTLGETSLFTIKAADNTTDLYCRLIKPAQMEAGKKYPVFVYVYGGPHAQLVTDTWMSGGLFLQYMAQRGFVVFTVDNRGSANRGFEFESVIHRNLGKAEMADQLKGIEYLKTLPFVDADRIGVDGWSYGGFLSVNLKLNYPEIFKVATAGGPVCDWKYYEVMYGERYMDTPEQNPDGYKAASLIEQAGKLQGKLLIIHGGIDNTVVWQHSQHFLKACIDQKKQLDYFVYPTHEHNVGGIDRGHLFRKIASYHEENQ